MTVGVEFWVFHSVHDDCHLKLCLWDASGAETYRSITRSYLSGVAVVYLVVDQSRPNLTWSVRRWAQEVHLAAPHADLVLIGNKSDLTGTCANVAALARHHAFPAWRRTSARTGQNVEQAFEAGLTLVRRRLGGGPLPTGVTRCSAPAVVSPGQEKALGWDCCLSQ